MTRWEKARRWLHAMSVMSRASRYGELFPPAGRQAPAPGPGSSHDPLPDAGAWRRFREEADWLVTSTHDFPVRGLDRPVDILHVTDIHLRGLEPRVDQVARAIAEMKVDLVAITGDVVTHGWTRPAVDRVLAALPEAPLGRWAVMGNWEYWARADKDAWRPVLARHGVQLLDNCHHDLGDLVIAGTDDLHAGTPDITATLADRPSGKPTVVLTHSPAIFPEIARDDVQLVLSGHTHGGQVRPPLVGALWVPRGSGRYISGWFRSGGTWMFVCRGIGWSVAPMRMWCPPELARVRLIPG